MLHQMKLHLLHLRKPIDYSKTIMYRFVCKDVSCEYDIYVGHTTDFNNRKRCHKSHCINSNDKSYNYKVYQYIRDNGGWNNWSMIEIEKYPCADEREATARERYWCEYFKADLNSQLPNRSLKEYQKQYRDQNKEQIKQYIEQNKDRIKEYYKQYREQNKDRIKEYYKQYREQNKEQIKEQRKQYRDQNKEQIKEQKKQYYKQYYKEKASEKINCCCGSVVTKNGIKRHERECKKHLNYIQKR
jgi:DNA repair exonuclease SbcCD ATPase subunit